MVEAAKGQSGFLDSGRSCITLHGVYGSVTPLLALGVVTPISTVLRAAIGDCDPVYGRCRCGIPYAAETSHRHGGFS